MVKIIAAVLALTVMLGGCSVEGQSANIVNNVSAETAKNSETEKIIT